MSDKLYPLRGLRLGRRGFVPKTGVGVGLD